MADSPFRIKKSAVLVPVATPTLTQQGELAYDSSDDKLKVRGSSTTDSVVSEAKTQALSNKTVTSSTIDADLNTITNIENADIKAGAAIDASKIANGTVSNTEFQYLGNVTSDIQTQIDAKAAGAASSVDNTLPRFDGITGKILQGSGVVVDDSDAVTGMTSLTVDSINVNSATISSIANPLILTAASGSNLVLNTSGGGFVDLTGVLDVTGQADIDNLRLDGNILSSQDTNGNIVLDPNGTGIVDIQAPTTITGLANVDNLRLDDNTISSTNTNGNILLDPNGTGVVSVEGAPLRLPEIATPATPSSGYGNVYFKSDGFLYQQNDDGTETKVGAGSGGINYITNPDAESTTTGWATYADAASSRPTDGTGGSPNVTWTRTTSSPLRGVGSFLFTKDAANRQGQGVSSDITISNADLARVLQISFDYEIASGTYSGGTSSTDSDLIVYMYRTTATGRLIEPSIIKLDGGVAGVKYSYRGEFQTDSDATGYRLIIHVATTSASAYTVKFDNVVIGPSQNVNGSIQTDQQSYTPTFEGFGTPASSTAVYYRDGKFLHVQFRVTTGTNTATLATISLPPGLTLDTSLIGTNQVIGDLAASATPFTGAMGAFTAATNKVYFTNGSADFSAGAPGNTWANGTVLSGNFRIPVVGWGATATLGQDADTRVLAMESYKASGSQTASGSYQDVTSLTLVKSDGIQFNETTGVGTITVAGWYLLDAQVGFAYNATGIRYVGIDVNGTRVAVDTNEPVATNDTLCHTQKIVYLNSGATFKMQAFQNSGGNLAYATAEAFRPRLSAMRQSGPAQIAASEVVALKYINTAGTSITSAVVDVPFATKVFDTHNAFNGTTGVFTAPATGKYRITGNLYSQAVTLSATQAFDIRFKVTSTPEGLSGATVIKQLTYGTGGSIAATAHASEIYDLVAGNTLQISAASDVTVGLSTTSGRNYICIERIGGIG